MATTCGRHAQVSGIELLGKTGGRVVPSYSYSCSLCCFSLSYSRYGNDLWVGGEFRFSVFHSEFRSHGFSHLSTCINPDQITALIGRRRRPYARCAEDESSRLRPRRRSRKKPRRSLLVSVAAPRGTSGCYNSVCAIRRRFLNALGRVKRGELQNSAPSTSSRSGCGKISRGVSA